MLHYVAVLFCRRYRGRVFQNCAYVSDWRQVRTASGGKIGENGSIVPRPNGKARWGLPFFALVETVLGGREFDSYLKRAGIVASLRPQKKGADRSRTLLAWVERHFLQRLAAEIGRVSYAIRR